MISPSRICAQKASWIARSLEAERYRKCHACSDFFDGMAIGERVAIRDVDGKLVIDLLDQTNQPGDCLLHAELPFVEVLCYRPHLPIRGPLKDGADNTSA